MMDKQNIHLSSKHVMIQLDHCLCFKRFRNLGVILFYMFPDEGFNFCRTSYQMVQFSVGYLMATVLMVMSLHEKLEMFCRES